jgi:phage gp29-like protein
MVSNNIIKRLGTAARVMLGKTVPTNDEVGATGTQIFAGVLSETVEYLTDLQGTKGYTVFDKMRRSDGQVKGALLACELPFHSAHWDIAPGTNDAQGNYIADALRENLFENMTITWEDILHHIMLMLPFGVMPMEKVWVLDGGYYMWRKWAPRMPNTIMEWHLDPTGGLEFIRQQCWNDNKFEPVDIPVSKLLVFTNEREGSNYMGISLLRAAYKHWWYKNTLYAIDGMAAERHGMGVAKFTYPPGATQEQKDKIAQVGERLVAHERAYVSLPSDILFELLGVQGQLHDVKGSIEHHDLQIARSILAQFMTLGSGSTGSFALSEDQSSFFLMALKAMGKNVCNVINRYAIREMVDYNWEVKRYPKITVSDLDSYDVTKMADALTKMVTAGIILPDEYIESEVRRKMHLPARHTPRPAEIATEADTEEQEAAPQLTDGHGHSLKLWEPRRQLQGAEQYVAFADIDSMLASTADKFVSAVAPYQRQQIAKIVNRVVTAIQKGQLETIPTIDVPYHKEIAGEIEQVLTGIYDYGKEQVKQEYTKQTGVKAVDTAVPKPAPKILIKARANAMASVLANKLRAALAWEALRQARGGNVDANALTAALANLSDNELRNTALFSATEAFNLGRQDEATELQDKIVNITSSSLLDDNTCNYCREQDGKSWQPDEVNWDDQPPYKDCEGRDRCRCVWVYTFASETPSVK